MKTAFIIIDVQNILVETGFEAEKLLEKIAYLQDQARKQQIEIIYMQHIETPEALTSEDWQLSPLLKRQADEKVFQKRYNSIFKETGLKEYLDQQGIEQLVLCGMQTEYCVDTSVKVGFEYGYKLSFQKELSQPLMERIFRQKRLMNFMKIFGQNVLRMS